MTQTRIERLKEGSELDIHEIAREFKILKESNNANGINAMIDAIVVGATKDAGFSAESTRKLTVNALYGAAMLADAEEHDGALLNKAGPVVDFYTKATGYAPFVKPQ